MSVLIASLPLTKYVNIQLVLYLYELQSYRTRKEMANEFLLQILRRRGPNAFQLFLKCLVQADENLHFIARQLDPDAPRRYAKS